MVAILPLSFLAILNFCLISAKTEERFSARVVILNSAVIWTLLLVLMTELLSYYHALTASFLIAGWTVICVLFFALGYVKGRLTPRAVKKKRVIDFHDMPVWMAAVILLYVGWTGLLAFKNAPTVADALSYHLPRVVYWAQNHTLRHYPSHIIRQLVYSIGPETVLLNFFLLAGSDFFSNALQWVCMIGSLVALSLIVRELGGSAPAQLASAALGVSLPMGLLQASTAQTDYAVSFWLLTFVFYVLRAGWDKFDLFSVFCVSCAFALAVFFKATAYFIIWPFLIWFMVLAFKRSAMTGFISAFAIMEVYLSVNMAYFLRNIELFNSFFYSGSRSLNWKLHAGQVLANIVRNVAYNMGTPWGSLNATLTNRIQSACLFLKLDVNDPDIISHYPFFSIFMSRHHDSAGNAFAAYLLFVSVVVYLILLVSKKTDAKPWQGLFVFAVIAGFVSFCAVVKSSTWITRLQLPFFLLASAWVAVFWDQVSCAVPKALSSKRLLTAGIISCLVLFGVCGLSELGLLNGLQDWGPCLWIIGGIAAALMTFVYSQKIIYAVVCLSLIYGIPWLILDDVQPIYWTIKRWPVPRIKRYYDGVPHLRSPYFNCVDKIRSLGCTNIGIMNGWHDREYLYLVLLLQDSNRSYRFQHVDVQNDSFAAIQRDNFRDFRPCAIIRWCQSPVEWVTDRGVYYKSVFYDSPLSVYVPAAFPDNVDRKMLLEQIRTRIPTDVMD